MLCFLLLPSPPVRSSYGAAIMLGVVELRGAEVTIQRWRLGLKARSDDIGQMGNVTCSRKDGGRVGSREQCRPRAERQAV
jgi:hypothetical protein